MSSRLILASGSPTRQSLLRDAGVCFEAVPAEIDEDGTRDSLIEQGMGAEEIAVELAKRKASDVAATNSDAVVLGCDQVLKLDGQILAKPKDRENAVRQLGLMNGRSHRLYSAAVIIENRHLCWRFTGDVALHMRRSSDEFLEAYVDRNWPGIGEVVGCYKIEEEGIRLFDGIGGDYFAIMGLPLLEVLSYLARRGVIPG